MTASLVNLIKEFVGDMGLAYNGLYGALACIAFLVLGFVVLTVVYSVIDRR